MIKKVKTVLNDLDIHTFEVLQKSSASLIVKVVGMVIGFGVSVLLGRTIGPDGLGIINLSSRVVGIAIVFALVGMKQVIIKEIAIGYNKQDNNHIKNVMFSSYLLNGGISLILTVVLILLSPWLATDVFNDSRLTYPLVIAIIAMTPKVFSRIFSSALVGFRKIWQSNLVEQTLSSAITGFLLLITYLADYEITVVLVAIYYAIGSIVVTLIMIVYWKKLFTAKEKGKLILNKLLKTSMPLLFVSAAMVISTSVDIVMLGWLTDSDKVGLYSVCLKLALLTSFFIQVTVSAISPKIAALYDEQKFNEMKVMVQKVTFFLTIIGFVVLTIFVSFGTHILSIWGDEFRTAYWILIILSIGQFFNISSGPVGNILVMTGHEKIIRNITAIILLLNIILNYVLIVAFGYTGAAISTAFTTALNMILCTYYVKKTVGFIPFNINYEFTLK